MNIEDVAREAGVSTATVSRVLNDQPVREENRRKVEAAIEKMEYIPNFLARGLSSKQSFAVGLLVTSISNSYYLEITEAIERRLKDRGFMLFFSSTDGDNASERRYLTDFMSRKVDGIIAIDSSLDGYRSGLLGGIAKRVPLVLINSHPEITGINSVFVDQTHGMVMAMDHLWSLGHREIAFLRGEEGYSYDLKETAWRGFLEAHGSPPAEGLRLTISNGNDIEAIALAEDRITEFLAKPGRPSALFACNDLMALGALKAAARAGVPVPEGLSIVGHDNTALAVCGARQLTSVDLKMRSLGLAATDLLAHAMDDADPTPRRIVIEPELVVRESSSRPGSPHAG